MNKKINMGQLLLKKFNYFDHLLLEEMNKSDFAPITRSESMIFASIDAGNLTTSQIAKYLEISRQAVHKTVKELESRGFITLAVDPNKKSSKNLILSNKGKACIDYANTLFEEIEQNLSVFIGKENVKILRNLLSKEW